LPLVGATTVTVYGLDEAEFPAASNALATIVCVPLSFLVFQLNEYGEDVAVAVSLLLIQNSTLVTPMLSVALAETVTVPETVTPFVGATIATIGGVVSTGVGVPLDTVTVVNAELPALPAAS